MADLQAFPAHSIGDLRPPRKRTFLRRFIRMAAPFFISEERYWAWGLAIGTVAGAICGPFLLNAIGAHRAGMRYRPILDWSDPGLHECRGRPLHVVHDNTDVMERAGFRDRHCCLPLFGWRDCNQSSTSRQRSMRLC